MSDQPRMYAIPERFRRIENLHIVFWLIKDLSWAMLWRPLGIIMIFPTIGAALLITWQTRAIKAELLHNLAIDFWICANAYWMVVEFMELPDHYRYFSAIPFLMGFICIAIYYGFVYPKEQRLKNAEITTVQDVAG